MSTAFYQRYETNDNGEIELERPIEDYREGDDLDNVHECEYYEKSIRDIEQGYGVVEGSEPKKAYMSMTSEDPAQVIGFAIGKVQGYQAAGKATYMKIWADPGKVDVMTWPDTADKIPVGSEVAVFGPCTYTEYNDRLTVKFAFPPIKVLSEGSGDSDQPSGRSAKKTSGRGGRTKTTRKTRSTGRGRSRRSAPPEESYDDMDI